MRRSPNSFHENKKSQSGSVLFYIMIAVALFAALGYTVGNMMRGGDPNMIGDEQAKIYAGEILNYARAVRQAVQYIKISNGCSDTDISFENSIVSGYTNGTNSACQIFSKQGGDVSYIAPNDKWLDSNLSGSANFGEYLFSGTVGINNQGTSSQELMFFLPYISLRVCNAINKKLEMAHSSGNPPVENADAWRAPFEPFTGTYGGANTMLIDGQVPFGTSGCRQGGGVPAAGTYFFYQSLILR